MECFLAGLYLSLGQFAFYELHCDSDCFHPPNSSEVFKIDIAFPVPMIVSHDLNTLVAHIYEQKIVPVEQVMIDKCETMLCSQS